MSRRFLVSFELTVRQFLPLQQLVYSHPVFLAEGANGLSMVKID